MILLIGIAAFELCTNLAVRSLVLRYLIAYIPSQLLAFGYVGLRGLKKLKKDKPWEKFDAIMAFAEWGLTRDDIGSDIDEEVFALIQSTGFKMLCG